jgi:hypothetical protein
MAHANMQEHHRKHRRTSNSSPPVQAGPSPSIHQVSGLQPSASVQAEPRRLKRLTVNVAVSQP